MTQGDQPVRRVRPGSRQGEGEATEGGSLGYAPANRLYGYSGPAVFVDVGGPGVEPADGEQEQQIGPTLDSTPADGPVLIWDGFDDTVYRRHFRRRR